ncbi:MAG: Coenzyme F420 hydrogenase/dehydrogenase, beta subunit C-terminal domain [Methanosarcinales archaeon]|nr:Coenzyme F420 hydrogenase/dehydrogenase, beta subunit C-terminal domain [Methanosarcinales archaeon]
MGNNMISSVVRDGLCTGCGTCVALCPENAIEMAINTKKGIYIPELNEDLCIDCGICYKVCPGYEVDFKGLNSEIFGKDPGNLLIGNYLNCYIGYSTDHDIRYNSTSGGFITQILIYLLEEKIITGALVTKLKIDHPLEPQPFIARTKEEIIEASKSKYCPVPANIVLKDILNSKDTEKFAVVGLPCHIQGIRKAQQLNNKLKEKILFVIGITCNHTPTFLATEFFLKKMNLKKENVKKIEYRGEGWPGLMKINLSSGKCIFINDYWSSGFGQGFFPIRCTLCCDHMAELSDVSFADAWLPEIQSNDNIGTSIVIIRNYRLNDFFNEMVNRNLITLRSIGANKVIQSQQGCLHFKKKSIKARVSFFKLSGKKSPKYNTGQLFNSIWKDYLSGMLVYMRLYLFSKRYLWSLMMFYQSVLCRFVNIIRKK